jgi:hypothetical protein
MAIEVGGNVQAGGVTYFGDGTWPGGTADGKRYDLIAVNAVGLNFTANDINTTTLINPDGTMKITRTIGGVTTVLFDDTI